MTKQEQQAERTKKLMAMGYFDGDLNDGESGGSNINVINNLTSTSATDALSANQGRVLDTSMTNLYNDLDARVVSIDTKVDGIDSKITSLDTQVTQISEITTELDNSIGSLDNRVTVLEQADNSGGIAQETDPVYTADKPSIAFKADLPDLTDILNRLSTLEISTNKLEMSNSYLQTNLLQSSLKVTVGDVVDTWTFGYTTSYQGGDISGARNTKLNSGDFGIRYITTGLPFDVQSGSTEMIINHVYFRKGDLIMSIDPDTGMVSIANWFDLTLTAANGNWRHNHRPQLKGDCVFEMVELSFE